MTDTERVLAILHRLHPDADFRMAGLIDNGILDSLDIVTLVTELDAAFDITVPAQEILPDNFNSAEAIVAMVRRLDDI